MGRQRAQLFERLAQKLDAVMADDNPDRTAQMLELSAQLQATATPQSGKGGMRDAPLTHGTPTLQAMPAGFVPPKSNHPAAKK